jgi:hypothetical protein
VMKRKLELEVQQRNSSVESVLAGA